MIRSIFISGAAAGIGKATALRFLQEGWLVGAYDRDSAGLKALQQAADNSEQLICGPLDVTDIESWQQALEHFTSYTGGKLNLLFNNAGILFSGSFTTIPLAQQQATLRVNSEGVLNGCYLAFPYLQAAAAGGPGRAKVVNMSSASAIYGQPSLATYAASKFAVRAFTEALNIEWHGHDIQVMDIMPLFVQTAMVKDMDAGTIRKLGVRINAETIANKVWQLSHYSGNKVHWLVGWQTHILAFLSKLSPTWLTRLSNKHMADL